MEELRSKHKSAIHNAAHQMALECIHPQVPLVLLSSFDAVILGNSE